MSKEPIRIAHIIGKWVGGGVESVVMNYYRHIDRSKIQFDFLCDEDSTNIPYEEIKQLGGKVMLIPPYQKIFKYQKELKRIFKENNYSIVHSHINTLSVFPLRAAKKVNVKVRIAHSHSTTNKKEWKKNLLKQVLRPFSKVYATDYMCCSELAGRWLFGNKTYDEGKVYLLNNAIDLEKFKYDEKIRNKKRKELNIKNDTLVIGHVGRFVAQKNHEFLIDIFNEVHKEQPNSVLLLVGQGPLQDKIKEKVKNLNLNENVKFLGQRNDTNELYNAMDVFVLPSLYEGLGIVVIEAQVSGCKCVVSTEVPLCTKISNNIIYEKLGSNLKKWSEQILYFVKEEKEKNYCVENYDIHVNAKLLEEKYIEKKINKISFFSQRWTSGGIEKIIVSIINNSNNDDNLVYEIVTTQKETDIFDEELKIKNVNLIILNNYRINNPFIRNIMAYTKYRKYIKMNNIRTAYINVYNSPGLIYAYISKKCGVKKIIVHAHNNGFDNDLFKIKKIINILCKIFFKDEKFSYIACSCDAAKFCFNKKNLLKCKIIKNGIDINKFKFNKRIRDKYRKELGLANKFVVGNVARMTEQKNQLQLIEIFSEILKKRKNSILIIIGEGPLENKIKKRIKEKGIKNQVLIFNKRYDIEKIMQAMDIFVFPSIYEGFGIVAIEAQAAGLPTFISSNLSNEVFATNLAFHINLKKTNLDIANFILNNIKNNREDNININEFDINYMIREIHKELKKEE